MRRWFQAALVLGLLALAPTARAGWVLEGSVGKGVKVSPSPTAATQTNIMIAPGYAIADIVRLELGLVADLPDVKASNFDFQLRPMVVLAPPILPLYGRLIFAVTNLRGPGDTVIAYGAAAGLKFGLGPVGVFAEAGVLPQSVASQMQWVIEGRLGALLSF
jgi:hypothetical protein